MPQPILIRPARLEDHADFARFFIQLGHHDPVPAPERWAKEWMPHTFFLEEAGLKVAYAYVEHFGQRGYVRHVVVDPDRRGRGLGRALMSTIAANLKKRGAKEWELNVRTDNERAIHLYERFGMRANHSTHVLRLEWSLVPRLDPPTRTPRTAAVEPKHDAGIEAAFDLPTGQLARLRSFSGHVLVQLLNELDEPVAVARFDPEFPGSFPFRMLEPELARPLLEAIRPHARPKPDWLQIVIENDAACAELLRENGARLVFEILHMRGKIP